MENQGYPQNLINAISTITYKPKMITDDIIAGVNYAVSTLSLLEQDFLKLKFQYEKNLDDICNELCLPPDVIVELENRAIKKLRHPWVYKYILYGIVGYTLRKSIREFFNGYRLGYDDAKNDRESAYYSNENTYLSLETPRIETLGLNKGTINCLTRAGIQTIGDCLMLRMEDIREIRGLGPIRADEVARSLVNAHIFSYNWEQFLSEPRLSRDWNEYHTEII